MLYFNTNKPHSFFLQNTSCITKPQVISRGGRGGAQPLRPPPKCAPVIYSYIHLYTTIIFLISSSTNLIYNYIHLIYTLYRTYIHIIGNICLQIEFLCFFFPLSTFYFFGGLGLGVAFIWIIANTLYSPGPCVRKIVLVGIS